MPGGFSVSGVITALVTPFDAKAEVGEDALREIVRFQLKAKVNGLFPLGTTGMGPVSSVEMRKAVAEIVVREVDGRVPVIVQVGAADPLAAFELAGHAEKIGADAVASLTPFFYQPGEAAILDYFEKLSQASSLPILVYNIPRNTGNNVDVGLLLKLCRIPNIVGIKDSSRDFTQLVDFVQKAPEGFMVVNGNDSYLFPAYCAGAQAGVSATANAFPELFTRMYEAYRSNNIDAGRGLQLQIHGIMAALAKPPIAPILEALKMRGLKSGTVKPPLRGMTRPEVEQLEKQLAEFAPEIKLQRLA